MDSINFTANYIKNVDIVKKHCDKYIPHSVSLIEMDVKNKSDLKAIEKTAVDWDYSMTCFVSDDMEKYSKEAKHPKWFHVYALTTQQDGFEKADSSKILGVIELIENGQSAKIETLQTNTKFIKEKVNPNPKYKHIGFQLVSYVQEKFSTKELFLNPVKKAISFYKKLGFDYEKGKEHYNTLVWNK